MVHPTTSYTLNPATSQYVNTFKPLAPSKRTSDAAPPPASTPLTITTALLKGSLPFTVFCLPSLLFSYQTTPIRTGPPNPHTNRHRSSHQWPPHRHPPTFVITESWDTADYCYHHRTFSSVQCSAIHMLFLKADLPPCAFSSRFPDLISSLLGSFHIWVDYSYLYNGFIIYLYALIYPYSFPLENVFELVTMFLLMRFINQSLPSPNSLGCIFCENSSPFYSQCLINPNSYYMFNKSTFVWLISAWINTSRHSEGWCGNQLTETASPFWQVFQSITFKPSI